MMGFRFEMWSFQMSDYQLVNSCHCHFTGPSVEFPLIPMAPLIHGQLMFEPPPHPHPHLRQLCLSLHIMDAAIKACQTWKVVGQKFELKKRKKGRGEKWGSLSCGALPLKASWPAICADSLAIATTPGRYSGERQPGMKGGRKRRGSLGTWDTRMSGCKFQDAVKEEERGWAK